MKAPHLALNAAVALVATLGIGSAAAQTQVTRPGDDAPALQISTWVKGAPVSSLEKGEVYVVEFWATWCKPCKEAMPHLSELARKYAGKATFIGVSIWEDPKPGEDLEQKVRKFVADMGDDMDYNVCMDDGGFMARNWVEATVQNGIPYTVIVDRQGRIAWFGSPRQLDTPLAGIVDGTYDFDANRQRLAAVQDRRMEQTRQRELMMSAGQRLQKTLAAKDYAGVVVDFESTVAAHPSYRGALLRPYIGAILALDPDKAYRAAAAAKEDGSAAGTYAAIFSSETGLAPMFYEYVIEVLEPAYLKEPGSVQNVVNAKTLASAYYKLGQASQAVKYQQAYLQGIEPWTRKPPPESIEADQQLLEKYRMAGNVSVRDVHQ